jgi:hypothetical protein
MPDRYVEPIPAINSLDSSEYLLFSSLMSVLTKGFFMLSYYLIMTTVAKSSVLLIRFKISVE